MTALDNACDRWPIAAVAGLGERRNEMLVGPGIEFGNLLGAMDRRCPDRRPVRDRVCLPGRSLGAAAGKSAGSDYWIFT